MPRLLAAALVAMLPTIAAAADRPVVIELFTSQGCSSCPPADAFLTELSRARRDVLPLAFHVTYWDYLGWKDRFSLQAATERQAAYGRRFGDGSYTPEMVVDGRKGLVGSNRSEAESAIAAARRARTAVTMSLTKQGETISIIVGGGAGNGSVVLVGFDPEHRTAVGRGENSGRTLTESNIVRSIRSVGKWNGSPLTLSAPVPEGQDAAVLLETSDGAIVGAARLAPSS